MREGETEKSLRTGERERQTDRQTDISLRTGEGKIERAPRVEEREREGQD